MTTKSLLITTAFLAALTLNASSQLVLSDGYSWPGANPSELNGTINTNIPARQGGTTTTTYTESFVNAVAGVIVALENAAPALSGSPDALFLRTQTSPTLGTVSNENISLDSNFTSLAANSWTVDYRARLTIDVGVSDNFFGLGFGSTAAPNGPTSDGFFFALRDAGAWLLWRNGATSFATGQLANFTAQQEYSVNLSVNETGVNPLLSVAVTPLGGISQVIGNNLPLNTLGASRLFAYQSSVVSDANNGFTDVRATDLAINVVPEPSSVALSLFGVAGLLFAGRRLKGQSKA